MQNQLRFFVFAVGWAAAGFVAVSAVAEEPFAPAIQALKKSADRGVVWDTKGSVSADVTCDGKRDLVILGRKSSSVIVAVVPSAEQASPRQPILGEFETGNAARQDAFCGSHVRVSLEPRNCTDAEGGAIPQCRIVRGCSGFVVHDDECDSFHFYWDNAHKQLTYSRL